ncbi:MFS transporter [Cellulomonas alba]|uniref:MFS transporter n=1 Tax=Cellulomonas alba TaxID=3053467 RepID=A0ABT7SJ83_9CELL|nr:MFS transporter [Cellulomonas alba]MDM7856099.1 MFS transporter [Cellulomonas alba]
MTTTLGGGRPSAGTTAVDPVVRRARWSLLGLFLVFGLVNPSWLSRLPSIRADLGLTSGQLGALLLVGACGSLVAVGTTGVFVTRFGARAAILCATTGNLVGFALVAAGVAAADVPLFAAGVLVNGACGAFINVPINLGAALVEQRVGRAILPHFHAAFSIGAAAGALVGAAFSAAHVSVTAHLLVVAVVVAGTRFALVRPATALVPRPGRAAPSVVASVDEDATAVVAAAPRGSSTRAALAAWAEPRTLLIGCVLLAASLSEGSASNWLALAVVHGFDSAEAVGDLAYGTFVIAMTVFRLSGTRLIDRYGRVAVLRASGVASILGLALFGLAPSLGLSWLGIVAWGCGAALANPIAIAAASDDPLRAPGRVSVVTSFSSVAQLSAPPVLGLLADGWGERHALLVICAAMVLSLAVAGQVRPLSRTKRQPLR